MTIRRAFLVVEGRGEVAAARNLVSRLCEDLHLSPMTWGEPIRGHALHTRAGIEGAMELVRPKRNIDALQVIRDEDDACPKETGPRTARWIADSKLPFPVAVVLLHREYETLLLPSIHRMAGVQLVDPRGVVRPGIRAGAKFEGDPQAHRDAKGILSGFYVAGRRYKPTIDQLALTRLVDFQDIRGSNVPAFGTLERALTFLASAVGAVVYPSPGD